MTATKGKAAHVHRQPLLLELSITSAQRSTNQLCSVVRHCGVCGVELLASCGRWTRRVDAVRSYSYRYGRLVSTQRGGMDLATSYRTRPPTLFRVLTYQLVPSRDRARFRSSLVHSTHHSILTHSSVPSGTHDTLTVTLSLPSATRPHSTAAHFMQSPFSMTAASSPLQGESGILPFSPSVSEWLERAQADSVSSWALPPLTLPERPFASLGCAGQYRMQASTEVDPPSPPSPPASISSSQSDVADSASLVSSAAASSIVPASSTTSASHSTSYLDHRRVDLQRRQRERVALRRLDELLASEGDGVDEPPSADGDSAGASGKGNKRRRRQKLCVLDASAARIQRLERQLSMARQDVRLLTQEVNNMTAREQLCVQWMDASRALHGGVLLHDRMVNFLLDCRSGRLLDASSSFFDFTGFTPGGVLQRVLNRLDATSSTGASWQIPECEYPLVRARRCGMSGAEQPDEDEPTEWVAMPSCRQYPHTLRLIDEFHSGKRDNFRAQVRVRWASGDMYEVQLTSWVADWEYVEEADGRRWQRPVTCVSAYSMDNHVYVDEALSHDELGHSQARSHARRASRSLSSSGGWRTSADQE